jgi:hypothetical protein
VRLTIDGLAVRTTALPERPSLPAGEPLPLPYLRVHFAVRARVDMISSDSSSVHYALE